MNNTEESNKVISDKIQVKVIKSSSERYWYANHIGQVFMVWEKLRNDSYVLTPDNYKQPMRGIVDNLISPDDCEIVPSGITSH